MKILIMTTFLVVSSLVSSQFVSTYAGINNAVGFVDGNSLASKFNNPHGIAVNRLGEIYIADRFNHAIRKIDTNGLVSTLAGNGKIGSLDGLGSQALFNEPCDLEIDSKGNIIVADTKNNLIRKITPQGLVKTIAGTGDFGMIDGEALKASFGNPSGIAIDEFDNIYVTDHLTHLVRKISTNGFVSTLAGSKTDYPNNFGSDDGIGLLAKFYRPFGISFGFDGNLYVADEWNHLIRKVNLDGKVTTIAGSGTIGNKNGTALQSTFNYPWDIVQDRSMNLYVLDGYNNIVRKIDKDLIVQDFNLENNKGSIELSGAIGLAYNELSDKIYISDSHNELIREVKIKSLQPKIILDTNLVYQNDIVSIKVTPEIYDTYEYYVNDSLVLTSVKSKEYLKIDDFGVVSLKVKGVESDKGIRLESQYSYLNSLPAFE